MRALHSVERKGTLAPQGGKKLGNSGRRGISLLLCLCMMIPMLFSLSDVFSMRAYAAGTSGPTADVIRQADPSTMDTYKSQLDFSLNTRVAGRLWSDKSVFAYGYDNGDANWDRVNNILTLNPNDDGVSGTIALNDDFLHVYSALGSSQQLNTQTTIPLDLVMVLDVSGSMGNANNQSADPNPSDRLDMGPSKIYQSVKAMNDAIDRLMRLNPKNRVGVVLFSSYSEVLMPLAHYAPIEGTRSDAVSTTTNNYIRITDNYHYSNEDSSSVNSNADYYLYGFQALQPGGGYGYNNTINGTLRTGSSFHSSGDGTGATGYVGSNTNIDSGMWRGLQMLLHSTNTTTTIDGKPYSVIPAFVFLGDGDPQIMMSTPTSGQWWNPDQNSSLNAGLFDDPPIVLNTVMRTSLMKSAVIKHYKAAAEDVDATNLDTVDLTFNTVGISLGQVGHTGYGTASATALLNPSSTSNGFNGTNSALRNSRYVVREAYNTWINWSTTNNSQRLRSIITYSPPSSLPNYNQVFDQLPASGVVLNDVTVTKQDVIENIYYTDTFFDADTAEAIGDVFQNIVDETIGSIFTPVSGTNDLGVGNAITYMDPVGKYMDVKDVKNLVLFGEMYNIVKTAVYDYQWNEAYIEAMENAGRSGFVKGETPLPQGWYRGEPTAEAEFVSQEKGLPDDSKTSEEAWNNGWVFRVNYQTAAQFVPTLNEIRNPDQALEKERKTEYTFYRIDTTANGETVDRNKLHMNPAYGKDTDIPDGVVYDAVTQRHLNTPGVYALSDLRIWVEDSGDFSDDVGSSTLTDTNFDEALWINVPANMLPLRKITIDEDPDGNLTYTTNLVSTDPGYFASFPLRVFYTVGVSEDALDDSNHINIAGAISPEYIEQNKIKNETAAFARNVPEGNLEFFSNWYNEMNRYGDYVTTNTDYSYGDPVTSFSPATSNRYYIFEKALPLYNTAYVWVPNTPSEDENATYGRGDGSWRRVVIDADAVEGDDVRTFSATQFGGKLIAVDLEPEDSQDTHDARQSAIWDALDVTEVHNGDIIFLKKARVTDVTKPEDETKDPFPSDGYFFLPIEYYELNGDGTANRTQYAITRKGSEFGSAYKAAGITNGDMLCWHDVSGKYTQDYPYLSYSETSDNGAKEGDRSRGKDFIGYPLDPDTGYYQDCDRSLHEYPSAEDLVKKQDMSDGQWVVCAKPGGLRVGNLAQNVQGKGGTYSSEDDQKKIKDYIAEKYNNDESVMNLTWGYYEKDVTRTANNYYVPTISTTSNIEASDIKVNVYLGNNGRLYVMDTTLLVTKMVEMPADMEVDPSEEFNFQVFINGVTGKQSAIVVKWVASEDGTTGSWQRQFHYIDLELDTQLFLQASNGTKATVDIDGCRLVASPSGEYTYADECIGETGGKHSAGDPFPSDGTIYYVFIGRNRGTADLGVADTAFRVYHNPDIEDDDILDVGTDDVQTEQNGAAGTFYASKVWLVSQATYDSEWMPAEGERLNPTEDGFNPEEHNAKLFMGKDGNEKRFELLTIDPNVVDESSELSIRTPYRTLSAYWTKELEFGVNANNDGSGEIGKPILAENLYDQERASDYVASHTAEFTLKHGQALLFNGIPSGTRYRFTEKLTDAQLAKGYYLKSASHNTEDSVVAGTEGVYSVDASTNLSEESANFINTFGPDLFALTKQLVDANGNIIDVPPEREFTFTITFTPPSDATVKSGSLYLWKGNMDLQSGGAKWTDGSQQMPDAAPKQSEYQNYILPASGEGTDKYLEPLKPNADGTYTVKLKAKQGAVIYGLIAGTHYTVVEKSVPKYPSVDPDPDDTGSGEGVDWFKREGEIVHNVSNYLALTPSDTPNRAGFVNQVFNGTLTVEKRVDNDGSETETKEFDFSVTLDPAEDADLTSEDLSVVKYANGDDVGTQITLDWTNVNDEEGQPTKALCATFKLKHGEKVVINGIPANTNYTVKETGRGGYNLQHVADNASNAPDTSGLYLDVSEDSVSGTITTENVDVYLLFVNGKAVAPPFTGGIGVGGVVLGGVLLIGLSVALFLYGMRKKRRVI